MILLFTSWLYCPLCLNLYLLDNRSFWRRGCWQNNLCVCVCVEVPGEMQLSDWWDCWVGERTTGGRSTHHTGSSHCHWCSWSVSLCLSVCLCVCLSVCVSVCLSVCLCVCLSVLVRGRLEGGARITLGALIVIDVHGLCLSVCLSVSMYLFVCSSVCLCLSVYSSVCLFVCVSIVSICHSVCLSISLSVRLSVCLSIFPSVCLFVCSFVCSPMCFSVCLYVCLFVCLSVFMKAVALLWMCSNLKCSGVTRAQRLSRQSWSVGFLVLPFSSVLPLPFSCPHLSLFFVFPHFPFFFSSFLP